MHDLIINYGMTVLLAVLAALTALIMYLIGFVRQRWISERLGRLWSEIRAAVRAVGQTYVDALKAAKADGKLTDSEKAEALSRAIAEAKSNFGMKGLLRLARALGVDDIDKWLGSKVEAVLGEDKAATNAISAAIKPKPAPDPS